jgi:hypothetical protein
MKFRLAVLLSLLCCPSALAEEGGGQREWTSADGKKISGLMLGTEGDSVAMRLSSSGKVSKIPLTRLSAADRDFVAKQGWPLPKPWIKWPSDIKIGIGDIQVQGEIVDGRSIYRTKHFEIISEAELGQLVIKDVARIFEGTYQLLAASPWGILARPEKDRFRAELYVSKGDYIKAGGPPNSAGVYLTERKVFMVPFESLGLKQTPKGYQRDENYTTKTLVHELTHMMMDDALQTMPMWLIEGTAEYMELIPMRIGTFSPNALPKALKDHNAEGKAYAIKEVFTMSHKAWQNGGKEPEPPPLPPPGVPERFRPTTLMPPRRVAPVDLPPLYHAGLLLTYYFMHFDCDGDAARLQRFISASVKNVERIKTYEKAHQAYEAAFTEFVKHPDVQNMGDGTYRYPSTMTPPEAPAFPFDCKPEELPFLELDILLEGRTVNEVIRQAETALDEKGLLITGKEER